MNDILVIGIAGGTGSGKSTLTNRIVNTFGDSVSVVQYDDYYKRNDHLTYAERCLINYDHPDAFDTELLINDVKRLKNGGEIHCPVYDFTVHNRTDEVHLIEPRPVVIVEGIMILVQDELRDLLDVKIYVDTDADIRVLRRIKRDIEERGRTLDSVTEQYINTVKPMHEKYVEPSKKYADVIIPEGGRNIVAADMVVRTIEAHLASRNKKSSDI